MSEKKIPVRTYIACRTEKPKRELVRIVRDPSGNILPDFSGRLAGRGAYVCPDPACIRLLGKKKLLNKAFSAPVDDEVYKRLEEEFGSASGTGQN